MTRAWILLALAFTFVFAAMVPAFYMAVDDLFADCMMRLVAESSPGLLGGLYNVVFEAGGGGHFRPVQDAIYVLAYQLFGFPRWLFAVMILYALCHVTSGALLFAILRRLRSPWPVAMAAAVLFVLHPVWDDNLASVQFGNNVPGLTAVLAACLLWLPVAGDTRRTARARLAGAAGLVLVAIGLGINLAVSVALILGFLALRIAWEKRSVRELSLRAGLIVLAVGVGLLHRQLAYGRVTTYQPHYQDIKPSLDPAPFLGELADAAVLLRESPTATYNRDLYNPLGVVVDDGSVPLRSWDSVACGLLAAVLLAVLAVRGRRPGPADQGTGGGAPLLRTLEFGAVLAVGMLVPYFLFIGRIGLHRYAYPSVAGIVVMATGAVAVLASLVNVPSGRRITGAAAALLFFAAVFAEARVSRESARSIAAGHRVSRTVIESVARQLAGDDAVRVFYVLGYPRVIGRAGYSAVFPGHINGIVNHLIGTSFPQYDRYYFDDLHDGKISTPLGPDVALFVTDPEGRSVRRVSRGEERRLPPQAASEKLLSGVRRWHLYLDTRVREQLLSPDREEVRSVLDVLRVVDQGRRNRLIAEALTQPMTIAANGPGAVAEFPALWSPSMIVEALQDLAQAPSNLPGDFGERVAVFCSGQPELQRALLGLCAGLGPESRGRVAAIVAVAASPDSPIEREALALLPPFGTSPSELSEKDRVERGATVRLAIASERQTRTQARSPETAKDAEESIRAIQAHWQQVGVVRNDLSHSAALCHCAWLADRELRTTLEEWTARGWRHLTRPLEALLQSRTQESLAGISLHFRAENGGEVQRPGGTIAVHVAVDNRSGLLIPGGLSPVSGWLAWRWRDSAGREVRSGQQWLPWEGLESGAMIAVPCAISVPAERGTYSLTLDFSAFGRPCASLPVAVDAPIDENTRNVPLLPSSH